MKKGISLIVLVITILVIIVLAGAVILTVVNNNPLDKATQANLLQSHRSAADAVILYFGTAADVSNINDSASIYLPLVNGKIDGGAAVAVTKDEFIAAKKQITDEGWNLIGMKKPTKVGEDPKWYISYKGEITLEFENGAAPSWAKDYDFIGPKASASASASTSTP